MTRPTKKRMGRIDPKMLPRSIVFLTLFIVHPEVKRYRKGIDIDLSIFFFKMVCLVKQVQNRITPLGTVLLLFLS